MLDHIVAFVQGAAARPDTPIVELPLLSSDDERELRDRWNRTARTYEWSGQCLHEPVRAQAARTPDAVAVRCGADTLSYRALDRMSNELASKLAADGVGVGDRVALLLEPSVDMAVAMLGVAKAGAAFVPLDPAWPDARRAAVLDDSGAAALVTEVPRGDGAEEPPAVTVGPSDLAHVFYTSGSTGRPKGVLVEHGSIVNRLAWAVEAYTLGADDRTLVLSPFTFDPFVWQLLCPLMVGGTAVIAGESERVDPAALVEALLGHETTITEFVPAMLTRCLEEPALRRCRSLRAVLCGSETMPAPLPRRFHEVLPESVLYNVFGPTETSIDSMWWRCDPADTGAVPIGHPIANTTVHVVDRQLRLVPVGVPGEICIGGVGVARGYLNRPDETARAFVADPFAEDDGARLYRTGDLGVRRADGALEFLGRIDNQVKVNGVRVEPGEVEQVLRSHDDVVDAAVIADHGGDGGARLRAFVTVRRPIEIASLRVHVARLLPPALIPASIAVLDRLPTDGNGKVDRRALAARAADEARPTELVAPRDAREKRLHAIWAEILGVEDFGVTESFFDLGGDSILSMQVVAMARRGGLALDAGSVIRAQSIEALARLAPADSPVFPPLPRTAPLAPAQQWFFDQQFAGVDHFNDAVLLRLAPDTDPERFLDALAAVVADHPELGARFTGGVQHFDRAPVVPVERWAGCREEAAAAAHAALDVADGRLGSAVLFEDGGTHELMVLFHHLVIDAVSWRTLLGELGDAHRALVEGQPAPARSSVPFGAWIERLAAHTAAGAFDAAIPYWTSLPRSGLTVRRDESPLVGDARLIRTALDPGDTAALVRVARARRVRFDTVLLSAFARALQPWTAGDGITVELEGHGRDIPGSEDLYLLDTVGWFTSLFPVWLEVPPGASGREALAVVQEQVAQIPHKGDSFGWLRYAHPDAAVRGALGAVGEPDVAFNYAGQFDHIARGHDAFEQLPYPPGTLQSRDARRTRTVEVNSFILGGALHVEWTCGSDPASAAMAAEAASSMLANLKEMT